MADAFSTACIQYIFNNNKFENGQVILLFGSRFSLSISTSICHAVGASHTTLSIFTKVQFSHGNRIGANWTSNAHCAVMVMLCLMRRECPNVCWMQCTVRQSARRRSDKINFTIFWHFCARWKTIVFALFLSHFVCLLFHLIRCAVERTEWSGDWTKMDF